MANGTLKVSNIETSSGSGTITIGQSGETISIPSGATIANSGTATGFGGDNTPMFLVRKSSTQDVSDASDTQVTFDTEVIDTDSAFASNTFTVPSGEGGKYLFNAGIRWDASADFEAIRISIRKNGASFSSCWGRNEYYNTQQITSILDLSATDTVDIVGKQSYGSSVNIGSADQGDISWFQGFKLT